MRVRCAPEALQDREDVWAYIAEDNPLAAAHMDELFSEAAERLTSYAHFGRTGKIPGTRELIAHENYRLIYEIADEVWVLALVHAARLWPPVQK
ncbi:translation repressor RelE [Caballeronia hypogeia]|uniref:Translation repressor RelE n=1 Tax=Caballeronia hypogeia TaxID=1777140 RepID=A0A158A5X5_9BURK|nr:type II toxin-antitoxin system mRNA interferase toxin, RelE/StbE family [Caballeronia hypogeia]SAK53170.1 translation repressor RelE [Caballeronia hypogeia]